MARAELAQSQQWANAYYSAHQIPADYGTPDDIANSYVEKRRAGMSHAEAMAYLETMPRLLGWETATTTPPPTPKPPAPTPTPPPTSAAPPAPIGVPTSGFGAAPDPYVSNPDAPVYQALPEYRAPTWTGGDYVNPTEAELYASPGYQTRLDAGLQARQRSAAAQGTILNGGTQKALTRYGQDYATNEYQSLRANTFENYKQRYSQFQDAAGMDLGARTLNANENQNTFANRTNTYLQGNTRTLSDFITNATGKRNSELDYWNRLNDLNQTGAGLAGGSR